MDKGNERLLSISEAQATMSSLPEQMRVNSDQAIAVTRYGRPVLAVLPYERYQEIVRQVESLQRTLHALTDDPDQQRALIQAVDLLTGIEEAEYGEGVSMDEIERELDEAAAAERRETDLILGEAATLLRGAVAADPSQADEWDRRRAAVLTHIGLLLQREE
jgi:PHD/YefM family antitoxin component YafN of YafNO toxin-antitoxin module